MLRLETETGWWLVTHPDHARLAGEFAAAWGNGMFARPEPREHVLRGIFAHDDGWAVRDAAPVITNDGRPAAFSKELVGRYSAFEEIDLAAYLAVRREAVSLMAAVDAYAACLISMHTVNLLTERADRSTIRPEQLPLLDEFLALQVALQGELRGQIADVSGMEENFRLLQACDNLSLLSCVDFAGSATLLHPLALREGWVSEVKVERVGKRRFQLTPFPMEREMGFKLRARFVEGTRFGSSEELQERFAGAEVEDVEVLVVE